MKHFLRYEIGIVIIMVSLIICGILYQFNVIPHKKYTNEHFDIETYISKIDKDNDGIDDQTDILNSVREYLKTKPKYQSRYYGTGYPNDGYGVCTDVVAFGLKGAGYDLMELVNEDIKTHREDYHIEVIDKHIDFRRVLNLKIYFDHQAISLTTDIKQIEKWQGGDIVVFESHIGIVSNNRNRHGVPFLIHHARSNQLFYEEDVLENRTDIIGHYRIS